MKNQKKKKGLRTTHKEIVHVPKATQQTCVRFQQVEQEVLLPELKRHHDCFDLELVYEVIRIGGHDHEQYLVHLSTEQIRSLITSVKSFLLEREG